MKKAIDYRESHTAKGKGKVYHSSFERYTYRRHMWKWEQSVLADIFTKRLHPESKVLDFACGTGRILSFLKTQSNNVTGVDVSDAMLEVSTKDHPELEIIKADITRNNVFLNKRQFDVISSFRFFLNAQNELRLEVLKALHPLLHDDGVFVFNNHGNTMGIGTMLGKAVVTVKRLFRKSKEDYTFYVLSHSKIKSLLKETGFEIVEMHHRSVFPILNEQTKFDVSKIEGLENWFSSKKLFRPIARNIIYVCKKV